MANKILTIAQIIVLMVMTGYLISAFIFPVSLGNIFGAIANICLNATILILRDRLKELW